MSTLYNRDILRLAVSIEHGQRLAAPHGSAELRSPACGSRVTADVELDDTGRVRAFGIVVNACALGQASSALLSRHVVGLDAATLAGHRAALHALLSGEAASADLLPESEHLASARDHPGRHAAILLPFDATLAALDAAKAEA